MTDHGELSIGSDLNKLAQENDYLYDYLVDLKSESGEYPHLLKDNEDLDDYYSKYPNVLYQTSDNVFINIFGSVNTDSITYNVIAPTVQDEEFYENVRKKAQRVSVKYNPPSSDNEELVKEHIDNILSDILIIQDKSLSSVRSQLRNKIVVSEDKYEEIRYILWRDIFGIGKLNPLLSDPNNEDIHIIGPSESYVDHGVFGLIPTSLNFDGENELDQYLRNLGERIENPVSDSDPIIDSTLPDGSRINIIYSSDVSIKGPSITIRQGEEVPLSILQITKWGTLSPKMVAYLWLALENDRTIFVVGETASGKTTTLNALLTFIPDNTKIYTAEDTAEVQPPQSAWQQVLTRESPGEESTDVTMFNLVEAALRSRPKYVIVGEVRGEEAQMAFQAAQTGHPVMLTFHASDVKSMIQRFTGNPINVPETFMDNCDIALFQNRVESEDPSEDMLRRVTSVSEIIGYSKEEQGVITREVFKWNSAEDYHMFNGQNNSHVLENQVAELMGYNNKQKIYDELERRTKIIERLIDSGVLKYNDVNSTISTIQKDGIQLLESIKTSDLRRDE